MGIYTENMEDQFWGDKYDLHEVLEYQEILDFFNSDFFPFAKRLDYFVRSIFPDNNSSVLNIIRECCKKNNVDISEFGSLNTLKSWISGERAPDQDSTTAREKFFLLAFALGLNVEQTQRLLTKVYLDRPIYVRNYRELIYYHCLENNYSYDLAKELIDKIDFAEDGAPATFTKAIQEAIAGKDTSALISYINTHKSNFETDSCTAQKALSELLFEAKQFAVWESKHGSEMDDAYAERIKQTHSDPESETKLNREFYQKRKAITDAEVENTSFEKLYDIIVGRHIPRSTSCAKKLHEVLPNELATNFPLAHMLSKPSGADGMRKVIILLFSYVFWSKISTKIDYFKADGHPHYSHQGLTYDVLEQYKDELNLKLIECGFAELYIGNPHDWLYCYCMTVDINHDCSPLQTFREIWCEIFDIVEAVN